MPILKLDLDAETYKRLVELSLHERRPIEWQAEVVLRRHFGLPFPCEAHGLEHDCRGQADE